MDLIVILCSRFSDLATTKYVTKLFFVSDLFANKQYKQINDLEKEIIRAKLWIWASARNSHKLKDKDLGEDEETNFGLGGITLCLHRVIIMQNNNTLQSIALGVGL